MANYNIAGQNSATDAVAKMQEEVYRYSKRWEALLPLVPTMKEGALLDVIRKEMFSGFVGLKFINKACN
jgi:uncharacterized protein HemY